MRLQRHAQIASVGCMHCLICPAAILSNQTRHKIGKASLCRQEEASLQGGNVELLKDLRAAAWRGITLLVSTIKASRRGRCSCVKK